MALKVPICALALFACAPLTHAIAAPTCTLTGFFRDSINLTAARINPATVTGDVDATGCNVGVYYSANANGHIENANIHGANYFGIVNNGAHVDVRNSTISDIGEKPFNGTQHGVAIYWAFGSAASGDIQNNYIWNYQKGGIVVNGPSAGSHIQQNVVIGLGPVNFIAQNGIQAGYGANTQIEQNIVSGNSYTGSNSAASGGILVVGGDCYGGRPTINTRVQNNAGLGNDVGVWFSNLDSACNPLSTVTGDTAQNNVLVNNAINNTTGNSPSQGYQAGISDQGDYDVIQNNTICGLGYAPPGNSAAALFAIDVTATNNVKVQNNTICQGAPQMAAGLANGIAAAPAQAAKAAPVQ